jgi:hypothetical protein
MFYSTRTKGQIQRAIKLIPLILLFLGLTACQDPNAQQSAIVREVEHAGAGKDISSLTSEELAGWFTNQPAVFVQQINAECKPLRTKAPAAWHMRTAEGRVCDAVMQVAPLKSVPYKADHTAY